MTAKYIESDAEGNYRGDTMFTFPAIQKPEV